MKQLTVVGLGPGGPQGLTAQAQEALGEADLICGYTGYIDLIREYYPDKELLSTPMTQEIARCRAALEAAGQGRRVAMVCSGDPGVYGMASPILELAEEFPQVEVEILPGVTASHQRGRLAGRTLDPRFCGDLPQRPAHPLGTDLKAAAAGCPGGFCPLPVQPGEQIPPRPFENSLRHPAGGAPQ